MKKIGFLRAAVAIVLMAIVFVTVFSYTTSPIYKEWGETPDSPIFQIIGKYWALGSVPYRDLWDLKGPYIFLINAIGYWLTGTRLGVYVVQIVFMSLTLLCFYKMFRTRFQPGQSLTMVAISLLPLSYIYEGGNLTEEYLLPCLSLSFLFILQWIDRVENEKRTAHPPLYAFVYGIVAGLSLMSRLTNSLASCAAVAVIALYLLSCKQYANLCLNIVTFIAGIVFTTLPFLLYFAHYDALDVMWNTTFLYAAKYAANATKDLAEIGVHYFLLSYFSSILLLALCVWKTIRRRSLTVRTCLWFMSALLPFVWFCQGNGFGHYGMTVLPLFAIAFIEIAELRLRTLAVCIITAMFVACASKVRYMFVIRDRVNDYVSAYTDILESVHGIDYSSFVAYNCDPNIYLALDIRPANPFFALQDFAIERNPLLRNDIVSSFRSKRPEWILLAKPEDETVNIQPMLDESYTIVATKEGVQQLILYKKK